MPDYAKTARAADRAFRENGQLIRLTIKTKSPYANGSVQIVTTEANAWGLDLAVSTNAIGTTTQSGTLVKAGDRKLIVSALADTGAALPAPKHGDTAQVGTQLYTVRNVDPLSPGGVVVLYNLIVGI